MSNKQEKFKNGDRVRHNTYGLATFLFYELGMGPLIRVDGKWPLFYVREEDLELVDTSSWKSIWGNEE